MNLQTENAANPLAAWNVSESDYPFSGGTWEQLSFCLNYAVLAPSRATVKGILLVALIKGTLGGLTFWGFGIEAPVLWGVVMTLLSILPIIGPWVVMVPAALIMLLTGSIGSGIFLLLAALAIGSIDNLLEPFLIGRDAGMHDLFVFFSMATPFK